MEPKIIYEDENTLVLNKPQGLLIHPDGRSDKGSLSEWLEKKYPNTKNIGGFIELDKGQKISREGIVHRIDKETSGVILAAKNQEAFDFYQKQFLDHTIKKTYHGMVFGNLKDDMGIIDKPIGRSGKDFRKKAVGDAVRGDTRNAITKWRVLERSKGATFCEFYPVTGRTHQIRIHLASIGHALIADSLYGKRDNQFGLDRVALHARSLTFTLYDGKEETFTAEYPEDFRQALEAFRALC